MKLKVLPVDFRLAKFLIDEWHRTNFAPVGHKASYIMIKETGNYEPVAHPESDFFDNWFYEEYPDHIEGNDFIFQADENGDPLVSSLGKIIGVVVIGRPVARFKDKNIMELTRICFNPKFNPLKDGFELPSQLVKKSIELFKEDYECKKFITYIHNNQKGKYLEFSGFKIDKYIEYSKNYKGWSNRLNRTKSDLTPKKRYVYETKRL